MAIFSSIATGKMKKSAGNAVFYRRLNKNIMRQKPLSVKNPKSTLQSYQRARLGNNAAYYRAIEKALQGIEWKRSDQANLTPYQAFIKNVASQNTPAFNNKGNQTQFIGTFQVPYFPPFYDSWVNSAKKIEAGEITQLSYVQDENGVDNMLMINELSFKTGFLTGENYTDITGDEWAQIVAETSLVGSMQYAGIYALAEIMNYDTKEHFYILRTLLSPGDDAQSYFEIKNFDGKDVSITFSSSADTAGEMICTINCANDSWHILSYSCGFAAADTEKTYIDFTSLLPLPAMYAAYAEETTFNKMKEAIKSYGGSVDKIAIDYVKDNIDVIYTENSQTISIKSVFNPKIHLGEPIQKIWVIVPKKIGKSTFQLIAASYDKNTKLITISGTADEKAAILEAAAKGHVGVIAANSATKSGNGGHFYEYASSLEYLTNTTKLTRRCTIKEGE